MKNKKRLVPWLIAAVIIAALAVIGKKLYDLMFGGCAYMIAMILGEVINFPIQRNVVFRSKGNLTWQIVWYAVAFCVITCIVNSINCIWVATAARYVPDFIYNIGTTVLNGGVSMVIFFFVNKVIFPTSD